MVSFMERIKETDKYMWQTLAAPDATHSDKARATAELRKNYETLITVMFDAGIFDRTLGEVKFDMSEVMAAVEQIEAQEKV